MPRHVTHPAETSRNAVYDRTVTRLHGETFGNCITSQAFAAVMRREAHRSGQGG